MMTRSIARIDGLSEALTPKQAAQRLQVCEATIWHLLGKRQLGSFTVGRSRRIPIRELDRYAAARFQPVQ